MNTITMKNGDIRQISFTLESSWDSMKGAIKVSGKALYSIIAIKRKLSELANVITESFLVIGQNHGGEVQPDGSLKIPDENIPEVNNLLTEIAMEEQTVEFKPIVLGENDDIPAGLMELLFDFIEMAD